MNACKATSIATGEFSPQNAGVVELVPWYDAHGFEHVASVEDDDAMDGRQWHVSKKAECADAFFNSDFGIAATTAAAAPAAQVSNSATVSPTLVDPSTASPAPIELPEVTAVIPPSLTFSALPAGTNIQTSQDVLELSHPSIPCDSYFVTPLVPADLTGSALPDEVAVITCAGNGMLNSGVEVYRTAADGSVSVATLMPAPPTEAGPFALNVTVTGTTVTGIANGYAPTDPTPNPSLNYTQTFTFSGEHITAGPLQTH